MVSNTFSSRRKKTRISAGFDIKSLHEAIISMAPRGGLEPPTNGLTDFPRTSKNALYRPTKALFYHFKMI